MSRDDEAYGTRTAIAASAFGHWLAAVQPDRSKFLIDDTAGAMSEALNKAMSVKITPEMLDAMNPAVGNREAQLRAAFVLAGFEVEG